MTHSHMTIKGTHLCVNETGLVLFQLWHLFYKPDLISCGENVRMCYYQYLEYYNINGKNQDGGIMFDKAFTIFEVVVSRVENNPI